MARFARLVAVSWAALLPILSLAEEAGGRSPGGGSLAPYAWLWLLAAVVVIVALWALIFRGRRLPPPTPPVRKP